MHRLPQIHVPLAAFLPRAELEPDHSLCHRGRPQAGQLGELQSGGWEALPAPQQNQLCILPQRRGKGGKPVSPRQMGQHHVRLAGQRRVQSGALGKHMGKPLQRWLRPQESGYFSRYIQQIKL